MAAPLQALHLTNWHQNIISLKHFKRTQSSNTTLIIQTYLVNPKFNNSYMYYINIKTHQELLQLLVHNSKIIIGGNNSFQDLIPEPLLKIYYLLLFNYLNKIALSLLSDK